MDSMTWERLAPRIMGAIALVALAWAEWFM